MSENVSRRSFVKVAVGGAGLAYAAAVGYPIYRYLNSPVESSIAASAVKEVTLDKADELPAGSAMVFKFGVKPALLIHHADGAWTAMSAVCTHMGCTVSYRPNETKIVCECHGGVFDPKTGDNVAGPPPKPLELFEVAVSKGSVLVKRA